jgi:hypothetical protein
VVEICNRFIKQLIKSYCDSHHRNWDQNLNAIAFAIRTAPNESTGYSPAALTFGRELRTPFDVINKNNNTNINKRDTETFVEDLVNRLDLVYKETTKNCLKARDRHIKQYNKHRQANPFKVGDLVLRTTHTLSSAAKGIAGSLVRPYEGPYKIVKQLQTNTYLLETLAGEKAGKRNADQLKPYVLPSPHQQANVAIPVQQVVDEEILPTHSYNMRKRPKK